MKITTLHLLIAISTQVATAMPVPATCADYSGVYSMDVCNPTVLLGEFELVYQAANEATSGGCPTRFARDVRKFISSSLTGGTSTSLKSSQLKDEINLRCKQALDEAIRVNAEKPAAAWDVTTVNVNKAEFYQGHGFLNHETGNFHQNPADFNQNHFLYVGDDPRKNDHYPTSTKSYQVGVDVKNFQTNVNEKVFLEDPGKFDERCASQAMMCCWLRDRQYKDNNGGCNFRDCVNSGPADNTNLCWTEDASGNPSPYPGDEDEGDLHCHGIAWGSEIESMNDIARFNNLFYVSVFDHMYQRGYVESITNNDKIANVQPMCGCLEEMNPVTRADCTEAVAKTKYQLTLTGNSFDIVPVPGTFEIGFQACEGAVYDPALGPEDFLGEVDLGLLNRKKNDLSAFVFRLFLEGKISEDQMFKIYEKIVGYKDPNDRENEGACADAYAAKFNLDYPVLLV